MIFSEYYLYLQHVKDFLFFLSISFGKENLNSNIPCPVATATPHLHWLFVLPEYHVQEDEL